jgi:hypothetical protein
LPPGDRLLQPGSFTTLVVQSRTRWPICHTPDQGAMGFDSSAKDTCAL